MSAPSLPKGRFGFAAMLLLFSSATAADEYDDIVNGCNFFNAEFGTTAIQICIDENVAARSAVLQYPEEVREIVARCSRGREAAWVMVKRCIDNDIMAEAALTNYGREYDAAMVKCETEHGHRGAATIKACVDLEFEAARPPTN